MTWTGVDKALEKSSTFQHIKKICLLLQPLD